MSTHGVGVFGINSKFSSGSLVFYEKSVGRTTSGDVLTIATSQVTIGGTGQDVDFVVYAGNSGSSYFKVDCGASTAAFYGVDVTVTGDLTIATEDLNLQDACSLEFGTDLDIDIQWDNTNSVLAINPKTDNTGTIAFGTDSSKGIDVKWYGATASYAVTWDNDGSTNGAWLFGADTKGITVSMYAITTGCGVFWTPGGDSNNGTFIVGATGGSKGTDFYAYGTTNGNYLQWDQSANTLQLVGTSAVLSSAGTTASSSTTTGSVKFAGGVGIAGALYIGTTLGMDSAASDIVIKGNTSVALEVYDSTTKALAVDTRNTVTGVANWTFTGMPATIAGASGVTWRLISLAPGTTTLTGSTGVDNMSGIGLYIAGPTLTDSSAITVAKASTVCIAAAPVQAGSVTLTAGYALEIVAGNFLTAGKVIVTESTDSTSGASGSIYTAGGVGVSKALYVGTTGTFIGGVVIAPTAAGAKLDFQLETEWVSGNLIDADFGSATTLSDDAIAFELDFNGNVTLTTDKDLTLISLKTPAFTQSAANTTAITGITLGTAGAIVQNTDAGTINWKGLNIQLPNMTQTTGTVNVTGIQITGGTETSGTQFGLVLGVDGTGLDAKFFGDSTGAYFMWDESADEVLITSPIMGNDGRALKVSTTSATPAMSDGYGVVEIDATVSGAAGGWFSPLSSWANITGSGAIGANFVCAQTNGIYADAGANTGSIVIFGMRASAILTDAPTVLAPFSLNTSNREITALFEMNANPDVGYQANAGETGPKVGDVPLFCDAAGQQYFVRIYSARG